MKRSVKSDARENQKQNTFFFRPNMLFYCLKSLRSSTIIVFTEYDVFYIYKYNVLHLHVLECFSTVFNLMYSSHIQ